MLWLWQNSRNAAVGVYYLFRNDPRGAAYFDENFASVMWSLVVMMIVAILQIAPDGISVGMTELAKSLMILVACDVVVYVLAKWRYRLHQSFWRYFVADNWIITTVRLIGLSIWPLVPYDQDVANWPVRDLLIFTAIFFLIVPWTAYVTLRHALGASPKRAIALFVAQGAIALVVTSIHF